MHDIPFDLLIALASLVYVFNNFAANVMAKQWSSAEKALFAWGIGVGGTLLAAHTDFANGYTVAGHPLNTLNTASLVFLGILLSSPAGVLYHLGQRIDSNGSGNIPDFPAPPAPPVVIGPKPIEVPGEDPNAGDSATVAKPKPRPRRL